MFNERFFSNLHNMIIPLYGFNHYHHANNCEEDIEGFIGRDSIIDKLSAWLKDSEGTKYSGAYLITGYRGMGKSSFVHKAVEKLKEEQKKEIHGINWKPNNAKYVTVTVNVGNELLSTKELLGMACKVAYKRFHEITNGKRWLYYRLNTFIATILILVAIAVLTYLALKEAANSRTSIIDLFFGTGLKTFPIYVFAIVAALFSGRIANSALGALWKLTGWEKLVSVGHIKHLWEYLIERIDADVTLSSETGAIPQSVLHDFGMYFKFGRSVSYPIADVPEMQEMLVDLLNLIDKHYCHIHFIFIIDELDKISPKDEERRLMPEYNISNSVKGISGTQSRQKVLSDLLANMKYFISSSKAKFVFVAGYDMYDETLSDISNREFNIHSIFNGHINVSSFFRRTNHYSGVESMIEQYLCHMLIDNDHRNGKEYLREYAAYCRKHWKSQGLYRGCEKFNVYERILERRIVFLHNFLTYLVYMSNGSPKKLAMYIEKYVRSRNRLDEKMERDKKLGKDYDVNLGMGNSEYYLFFDSRNVQRICFVNYLIFPMIQNLVDKSNIYNDKLLVSTSFMISNLYKFHKSGFSMRNLEYMPELLDINKMPELRDFIGGIVDFLTQTHIDESVMNLYKYKFPMHLSEEITFFSKTSEEISYLFNFSHDELLSVKNLYMRQLEHYNNGKYEVMAVASLHHMLGDIYMLEENYELAIYEFQEALVSLHRQAETRNENLAFLHKEPSRILFYIRLSLKLGLAYEKRKTYDTAYLTYEQLVRKLLEHKKEISIRKKNINKIVLQKLQNKESLFNDIRITYLAPLAKLFVLEKMDLGGFTKEDVEQAVREFTELKDMAEEKRPIMIVDFNTKLGDMMYYRNKNEDFLNQLVEIIDKNHIAKKQEACKCRKSEHKGVKHFSCAACFWYNSAIKTAIENILYKGEENGLKYNLYPSKALFFLNILLDKDSLGKLSTLGSIPLKAIAKSLVGIANCLLGCSHNASVSKLNEQNIHLFFDKLYQVSVEYNKQEENVGEKTPIKIEFEEEIKQHFDTFMKSQLYYWSAALIYEMIGEYKSAYSVYCQMLDSIQTCLPTIGIKASDGMLNFCHFLAIKSIQDSYKHYGHINTTEIDSFKRMLNLNLITDISLDDLSNSPDIEIILYKYYHICFFSDDKELTYRVLNHVLSARQLGCEKIISSLVQNIQNLRFKEEVNEQILFLLMPEFKEAFYEGKHNVMNTLQVFQTYLYNKDGLASVMKRLKWNIFDEGSSDNDNRFQLLIYLTTDSLFCLNKVTDILSPLYSTTLYNNMYIGECYEREFVWNHLLISLREILYYAESKDINHFIAGFQKRFRYKFDENKIQNLFANLAKYITSLPTWYEWKQLSESPVEIIYDKICPSSHRYLTSTYLIGNAVDYYHKAVEMHTGGKTYKEMMSTLYFLEDDLFNNSCYFKFALELYCLNNGHIQKKIDSLERSYYRNKGLFDINNYLKNKRYE